MIWRLKSATGSSPLTRGKHGERSDVGPRRGLIPTHAGKTCHTRMRQYLAWAHPHSRGENWDDRPSGGGELGSSPLTRGKLETEQMKTASDGLIPTHAGKTTTPGEKPALSRPHPHSRGENARPCPWWGSGRGSSPLTRGKHGHRLQRQNPRGLIPTHAGKTPRPAARPYRVRAHPHSRGENACASALTFDTPGSSPLTRGKPRESPHRPGDHRLIPTHAGKTEGRSRVYGEGEAHPHSRGENAGAIEELAKAGGSSPLTRGKPLLNLLADGDRGLIPAHAGKTTRRRSRRPEWPAHPRSRGENSSRLA